MLPRKLRTASPHTPMTADERWRLVDLEAAQRRNPYAAGRGDGRERTARRRWARALSR